MKNKGMKAVSTAIYVRVSTEDQAQEGYSIRAQIEKLKAYALLKDWDIYDIYADEGISGKNIVDRPAINRMIDDIENGKVKNVLVFKVDRLTRSTKNLIELVDLFEENKCTFNSLTESIDTDTPSGRMFLRIIGIFAEFERENLSSRVKLGFERKAKEGYTLANNHLSYGYTREKGQKIQQIEPAEAQIVKEIFEMYIDKNMAMSKIAKTLNERKIQTKNNSLWDTTTIKRILTNPNYIGKVRYSCLDEDRYFESDGHHERIISDEMYHLTQEKMKNTPGISRTKRPKDNVYFCGILACGMCGDKFTTQWRVRTHKDGNKVYTPTYRCQSKQYCKPEISCECPDIAHTKVEDAFIEYIKKYNDFAESEINGVSIENETTKKQQELYEYATSLESKRTKILSQKKRVNEQYAREELRFFEYKELLAVLNGDYERVESELQRINAEIPTLTETPKISREDIISNIKENWDYLNNTEKMIFMQRFMKKIVVNIDKEPNGHNSVKIKELKFNLSSEFSLEQRGKMQSDKDVSVRKTLKNVMKNQVGSKIHFKRDSEKKRYKRLR